MSSSTPDGQPPQGGRPVRLDEALAALAMALICAISLANVVVRYLTDVSFAFTEEFSVFLLVFMTLVGSAVAFATDGHIRIVFFRNLLSKPRRRILDAVALLLAALLFAMVLYYGALFTWDEWQYEETSPGLGYPTWIYSIWLPLLSGWILVRIAGRLNRLFRHGGDA